MSVRFRIFCKVHVNPPCYFHRLKPAEKTHAEALYKCGLCSLCEILNSQAIVDGFGIDQHQVQRRMKHLRTGQGDLSGWSRLSSSVDSVQITTIVVSLPSPLICAYLRTKYPHVRRSPPLPFHKSLIQRLSSLESALRNNNNINNNNAIINNNDNDNEYRSREDQVARYHHAWILSSSQIPHRLCGFLSTECNEYRQRILSHLPRFA